MALPEPFGPAVCERLRKLAKIRDDAIVAKKGAESERDRLRDEISACGQDEAEEREHMESLAFREIDKIERYRKAAKAAVDSIISTIQQADEKLFDDADAKPTIDSLFEEKEREKAAGKADGGEAAEAGDDAPGTDESKEAA